MNTNLINAKKLANQNRYEEALKLLDKVIEEEPNDFHGYYEKAYIYSLRGMLDKAVKYAEEANSREKRQPMLHFSLARWLIQLKEFENAYESLSRVIEIETELNLSYYLESAYFYRAISSFYLGNYSEVRSDCEKVSDDFMVYILGKPHSKKELLKQINN